MLSRCTRFVWDRFQLVKLNCRKAPLDCLWHWVASPRKARSFQGQKPWNRGESALRTPFKVCVTPSLQTLLDDPDSLHSPYRPAAYYIHSWKSVSQVHKRSHLNEVVCTNKLSMLYSGIHLVGAWFSFGRLPLVAKHRLQEFDGSERIWCRE